MNDSRLTNPNKTKQSEDLHNELNNAFAELIKTVEQKFKDYDAEVGHRINGLGKYIERNLQGLSNKIRQSQLTQSALDISLTSLLEELIDSGVISKEKYEERTKNLLEKSIKINDAEDPK